MEHLLSAAEQVLRHAGAPALRLSTLLDQVRSVSGDRRVDPSGFRTLLEGRPDRFRVLDPWRGPWRPVASEPEEGGHGAEPWVVAVRDGGDGAERPSRSSILDKAGESVRWLALTLDAGSVHSVMRWNGLALEEIELRRSFRRAA